MNIDVTVYLNVRPQSLLSMMQMLRCMSFHPVSEHSVRAAAGLCMCQHGTDEGVACMHRGITGTPRACSQWDE